MQNDPFAHIPVAPRQAPAAQPTAPAPVQPNRRVIGGIPTREVRAQNADERAANAEARAAAAAERTAATQTFRTLTPEEVRAAGLQEGGVYQVNGAGNINTVQAPQKSRDGGSIPVAAANAAKENVGQLTSLDRAVNTFDDNFAGNFAGGLENTTEAYLGIGTPGQSEWWADFRSTDNLIRNTLFGASLTEGEKKAYNATTVTPGMRPDKVRANLQRRLEIVRGAVARDKEFYLANGYKPEAVEALFAPLAERPQAAAATPPQLGGDQQDTPPAFAAPDGTTPPTFPDLRPGAGLDNGDGGEGAGVATGDTRREDDPALSGVRQEYARRLGEGQTAEEIIRWAREAGISPTAFRSIQEQIRFRDANPGVPIEQYDTTQLDDRFVPVSGLERAAGQAIMSPLGTGVVNAANALSGFTLDNIVGGLGGNAERARLAMGVANEANPGSALLGTVAGGVGAALTAEAGLARMGVQQGVGRALAADVAYGAGSGAGATDDGSSRLMGAAQGGLAAGAGSLGGQAIGRGLSNVARGNGNQAVRTLRDAGVTDLTVGQVGNGRVGQAVRSVEDRLSGIPVVGDMVNTRRTEALRQFNQAAFKKALEPIGGDVGDKVGMDAIEEAQGQVGQAFRDALAGKAALPDDAFARDLGAAVAGVGSIKRLGEEVVQEIGDIMRPYADDAMLSGEALDDISRSLRDMKARYIASGDPQAVRLGRQVDRVERAVFDLFDRQASGTIEDYRKARAAYRRLSTLEDAVLKAQNQTDNVFTPAQLGRADTSNTRRFGGKRAAARGDTPFNELQQAGQEVLPNRVPDSGTAGRMLIPLVAVGAGGAADYRSGEVGTGLTIGTIIAGLYSRGGQRLLTKPARGMAQNSRTRRVLENTRTTRALGALGGAGGAALASPQ